MQYPNGHRNIIHVKRGVPPVPFFQSSESLFRAHVATGDVIESDTKVLYNEIRRTGGIAISHTSTTRMGTDWRDNDPELEPVVEIFQGDRYSYECAGCPLSDKGDSYPSEGAASGEKIHPAGFVSEAWAKGYRLGVVASSDHWSTHISYAMVYATGATREAIVEAMRKRHTCAATDNIIVDYRMGDHFMGDEFTAAAVPPLTARITGTANITDLAVIRNNKVIYQTSPGKPTAELQYEDRSPEKGLNFYYIRAVQENNEVAWASPIWVTVE